MPDPAPNRRRFQFSLRLLLLVVVAGNVFWWAYQHDQSVRAEAELARAEAIQWKKRSRALASYVSWQPTVTLPSQAMSETLRINDMMTLERWMNAEAIDLTPLDQWVKAETGHLWFHGWAGELNKRKTQIAALKARLKECGCANE